jgi:DNA-binding transcriptional ArsR family regulator
MALRDRPLRHLLQWLIVGTRGGANRAQIIWAIRAEPRNANQLGSLLEVDYRTIRHHLDVLEKNGLITSMGDRYGKMYFLSSELDENFGVFEEIWNEFGKKLNSKKNGVMIK